MQTPPQGTFLGPEMPNAQIWLFGPDPPKMKKNQKYFFHQKHLTNTLPTSPQPLSDHHFSPRYGQKRVFDVDPYVAVQIITPMGEMIKPLEISRSFSPYN